MDTPPNPELQARLREAHQLQQELHRQGRECSWEEALDLTLPYPMKIVIELNDETLRQAVDAQVGAQVARYTESVIQARVNEIVDKKLERVGTSDLQQALVTAANKKLDDVLGNNDYVRRGNIHRIIGEAAVASVKKYTSQSSFLVE